MLQITPSFSGYEEIQARLAQLDNPKLVDDILDEGTAILLNRIRTRFLGEVDPDDATWIPSKAGLKRRAMGGTGTLFDTGTLFHSIQAFQPSEPGSRGLGTDVFYAPYLQNGTHRMPPRVFLGFGEEDISVVSALVLRRVSEALA